MIMACAVVRYVTRVSSRCKLTMSTSANDVQCHDIVPRGRCVRTGSLEPRAGALGRRRGVAHSKAFKFNLRIHDIVQGSSRPPTMSCR